MSHAGAGTASWARRLQEERRVRGCRCLEKKGRKRKKISKERKKKTTSRSCDLSAPVVCHLITRVHRPFVEITAEDLLHRDKGAGGCKTCAGREWAGLQSACLVCSGTREFSAGVFSWNLMSSCCAGHGAFRTKPG